MTWTDHIKAMLWPLLDVQTLWHLSRMPRMHEDRAIGLMTAYDLRRIAFLRYREMGREQAREVSDE